MSSILFLQSNRLDDQLLLLGTNGVAIITKIMATTMTKSAKHHCDPHLSEVLAFTTFTTAKVWILKIAVTNLGLRRHNVLPRENWQNETNKNLREL